jgi:hypothetical protein
VAAERILSQLGTRATIDGMLPSARVLRWPPCQVAAPSLGRVDPDLYVLYGYEWNRASDLPFEELLDRIGIGWHRLVLELHSNLLALASYRFIQCDQQFGCLRFRAAFRSSVAAESHDLVLEAERKSMSTCEVCAGLGRARRDLIWIRTLCHDCYAKNRAIALEAGERAAAWRLSLQLHPAPDPFDPDGDDAGSTPG